MEVHVRRILRRTDNSLGSVYQYPSGTATTIDNSKNINTQTDHSSPRWEKFADRPLETVTRAVCAKLRANKDITL